MKIHHCTLAILIFIATAGYSLGVGPDTAHFRRLDDLVLYRETLQPEYVVLFI